MPTSSNVIQGRVASIHHRRGNEARKYFLVFLGMINCCHPQSARPH